MAAKVPECPEIEELVITDAAVHLIVRIRGSWDERREELVAEVERKTQAATKFAASAAFRERYSPRIGVARVEATQEAPSIVSHLLAEQGIEIDTPKPDATDGGTCTYCGRRGLTGEQERITDSGTACPTCFRAWNVRNQPDILKKPRTIRIPPKILWPLVVLLTALFLVGVYYELQQLNHMNRIIRMHMPTE